MVIKKLNNLFHKHSRILFGAFTVLIILAFTDFLTPGNISGCDSASNTQVGTAFGKKVSADDLQKTYRDLSLYAMVVYGGEMNFEARRIFYQFCQIKRAEQLGITVSDAEIAEKIRKSPIFGEKFSVEAYDKFLKDRGLNPADLNEAMRQNMKVEKMLENLTDSVVVSDAEAKAFFANMEQKMELAVCSFKNSSFQVAEPSAKELEIFYNKNQQRYMSTGSLKTVSAVIPFAKYKDAASKKVTPEMIAAAKKQIPGDAVKDETVKDMLIKQIVSGEAQKEAITLYQEISAKLNSADPVKKQLADFRAWAAEKALEVAENSKAFDISNQLMQQMPLTGSRLVRGFVPAENGVMIVMLIDRVEPQKQALASVKNQVIADYKAAKQQEEAVKTAEAEAKKLSALKADVRLNAFKALKGVHRTDRFPEMPFANAYGFYAQYGMGGQIQQMYTSVFGMNINDISPVSPAQDGAEIFIVISKTPADEKDFEARKNFYIEMVKQAKATAVLQEFAEDMQRQCQFTMASGNESDNAGEQAK